MEMLFSYIALALIKQPSEKPGYEIFNLLFDKYIRYFQKFRMRDSQYNSTDDSYGHHLDD